MKWGGAWGVGSCFPHFLRNALQNFRQRDKILTILGKENLVGKTMYLEKFSLANTLGHLWGSFASTANML